MENGIVNKRKHRKPKIGRSLSGKWFGIAVATKGTNPLSSVKQIFYNSLPTRDCVRKTCEGMTSVKVGT